jgi:hypothetical protein
MRHGIYIALGTAAVMIAAAYAELVLDIRAPLSELESKSAVAAITQIFRAEAWRACTKDTRGTARSLHLARRGGNVPLAPARPLWSKPKWSLLAMDVASTPA